MINISPFSQVCIHRLVKCCPKQVVHPLLGHLTSILSAMNVLTISSYRVIFVGPIGCRPYNGFFLLLLLLLLLLLQSLSRSSLNINIFMIRASQSTYHTWSERGQHQGSSGDDKDEDTDTHKDKYKDKDRALKKKVFLYI